MKIVFYFLLLFNVSKINGQQKQFAVKFIEPNIAVSYDTVKFAISEPYTNAAYGTEAYDFKDKLDKKAARVFHIGTKSSFFMPEKSQLDSAYLMGLFDKRIKKMSSDVKVLEKKVVLINEFWCAGILVEHIASKKNLVYISGLKVNGDENVAIDIRSSSQKDLNKDFNLIREFLKGYKYYTQNEIAKEDSLIRKMYSVEVIPVKKVNDNFLYRNYTFLGKVFVKEPLQHKLNMVTVDMKEMGGREIFSPNKNKEVFICVYDTAKKATVRGWVEFLNSFGKKVNLPFEYNYVNKGELNERMKPRTIYIKPDKKN